MLNNLSLLLVDDDIEFIEMIASRFSRKGASVRICIDAASARAAVDEQRPDLVMLDRKIGADDGIELTRSLRCLEPSMPVVMLSGYSDEATMAEAREAGVARYLTKPLSMGQIEVVIRDLASANLRECAV